MIAISLRCQDVPMAADYFPARQCRHCYTSANSRTKKILWNFREGFVLHKTPSGLYRADILSILTLDPHMLCSRVAFH